MPRNFPLRPVAAAIAGVLLSASGADAQAPAPPAPPAADEPSNTTLLRDFIHYTRIARYDAAAAMAQQLLDRGVTPGEFVTLVETSGEGARFEETVARAMRVAELQAAAASLQLMFDKGKLERVRDPGEIAKNIALLTGNQRARLLARERLAAAGEYAMPQLLSALLQRGEPVLQSEVHRLLIDMSRQVIIPLATALTQLDPTEQEQVVDVLGLIPYRTSLPFLYELRRTTDAPRVRDSVQRAIGRILEKQGTSTEDAAALYYQLANDYYAEKAELTSFPGEPIQLLWAYDPSIGLHMRDIATPVYHEAMAMRMAERSLGLDQSSPDALALWVASNFSREIDTPEGYVNPAYPEDRREAMYFAVAAGADTSQRVLGRGLDTRDTPLVRRAVSAIEQTAGGTSLWSSADSPLLEALRYPNRRVQYETALALAAAQPTTTFEGSDRVVPTLASAVRDAASNFAVVIAPDSERYQGYRAILEGMGYTVLPWGRDLDAMREPITQVPGIDLIVAALPAESAQTLIVQARETPSLSATPILALLTAQGDTDLGRRYGNDSTVMVRPSGLTDELFTNAVNELQRVAAGGQVSPEEARDYAQRALAALRDLAVSGNGIFSVEDAALPLISVLTGATGEVRMQVAEILSWVNQRRAQVAIMDAAMNESGDARVALLGTVADSAKRFRNQLEPRQVARLVELASAGTDAEATAAAALMGALNLPNADLIPLILEGA